MIFIFLIFIFLFYFLFLLNLFLKNYSLVVQSGAFHNNYASRGCTHPTLIKFVDRFLRSPLISEKTRNTKVIKDKILFIERDIPNKLPHPRAKKSVERRVDSQKFKKVIEELKKKGHNIESIGFSNLSIDQQIEKIRSSNFVISLHGAAFTHSIFSNNETYFIELVPASYRIRFHHIKLASFFQRSYYRIDVEGAGKDVIDISAKYLDMVIQYFQKERDIDYSTIPVPPSLPKKSILKKKIDPRRKN